MKTKKKKKPYVVSFKFGEAVLEGSGETVLEAIQNLVRPVKVIAKGFLKVSDGKKEVNLLFSPARSKRLFYPVAQSFIAKQLEFLLKS